MRQGSARRRAFMAAIAVVVAGLAAPIAAAVLPGTGAAQTCPYPFNNCPPTSTSPGGTTSSTTPGATTSTPPSTTPGGTTTSTTPGATTSTPPSTTPGGTTTSTTPGATTSTPPTTIPGATTTTTPGAGPQLVIILDLRVGRPGAVVHAIVCNAPLGTEVRITFNGILVARAFAGSGNCPSPSALGSTHGQTASLAALGPVGAALSRGRLEAQTPVGVAQTSFVVPTNLGDGDYLVCAEAPGLGSACAPFKISSTAVLGSTFSSGAPVFSASNPNSFLAFTGLGLVRLLLLAATLIALGWFLVRRERRPRRA